MAGLVERFASWLPQIVTEGRASPLPFPKHPDKGPYFLEASFQISRMEPGAQVLFAHLLESEEFDKGLEQLSPLLRRRGTDPSRRDSEKHFVGFLFEHLSFYFVQTKLKKNQVVFSPRQTEQLYERLYPEDMVQRDQYGLSLGIKGITIPDGILLEQHQGKTFIRGVYEYSLARLPNTRRKQNQRRFYNSKVRVIDDLLPMGANPLRKQVMGEYVHRLYPHFPVRMEIDHEKFNTFYIFPRGENETTSTLDENISVVPFSRQEFGFFVNELFKDIGNTGDRARIEI
ncbi:hypothetical protein HYV21_01880 [Candidatus Microgenomates bacterium]|nr:hypothetical protein [Candidatus Microgenomates bacterium]